MRKRILTSAAGLALGLALPALGWQVGAIFGLFPNRDLTKATNYLRDVMQIVNENYVDPAAVNYEDLAHSAIHGMVENLDPHSEFLEAKDSADLDEDLSGEFGGVGIQVEMQGGRIEVIDPMPGTPADRAGIRRGDVIESIDGRNVAGEAGMDTVVDHLRGKPDTRVEVGLLRPASGKHFDLSLKREIIKVDSVTGERVLDDNIGYLQITEFSEHTGEQFADAVDRLLKKNIDSLIVDLRNNPGGLLDSAVEVAEPFFRKGELIVYTQGRKPSDREDFRSEADGDPLDLPVAVLVNQDTASAAEIVTAALKDTGRAVVVGERTFGKGSVQSIIKLKNGEELRLTTGKYYTPSGVSINAKGVSPQVDVVLTSGDDDKIRQQLQWPDITDPREFKERFGFGPIEDEQLDAALDVLKGVDVIDSQAESAKPRPVNPPPSPSSGKTTGLPVIRWRIAGAPRHDCG